MNDDHFQLLMDMLTHQTALLERIAIAVEATQQAPNYQVNLTDFARFDWSNIAEPLPEKVRRFG